MAASSFASSSNVGFSRLTRLSLSWGTTCNEYVLPWNLRHGIRIGPDEGREGAVAVTL